MDYSVGSLSDLITGANTPNKPKVVRKEITPKNKVFEEDGVDSPSPKKSPKKQAKATVGSPRVESAKKQKKLKRSISAADSSTSEYLDDLEPQNGWAIDKLIGWAESPVKEKKKSKKSKSTIDSDTSTIELTKLFENSEESLPESPVKQKKPKKPKSEAHLDATVEKKRRKRKAEDAEDAESDVSADQESSPNKSKNEMNAERRVKKKDKAPKVVEDPEVSARTVFVGNLPITTEKNKLKKYFMKYGSVESVRIRGVPVADPKTPKKVAMIKKEFNPKRNSFHGYVRFENPEDAAKATEANGLVYKDHHLRVHVSGNTDKPDENKALFIGNLSFNAEEEELWELFESCGPISSVRIIRDARSGMGKGFGYINFQDSDSVQLALEMEDVKLKDRVLRISLCNINAAKKNKKNDKAKKIGKARRPKKQRQSMENNESDKPEKNGEERESVKPNIEFQGAKIADKKKKNKLDKGLLQKKKMIKKLAPKVK